ncbi:hypothetical protein G6F62_009317 [Rhizopus arrhizus]|nr:hypothetical protein G6F32_014005 [Rhizopus arrhizus]KAG1324056.1 hypothetical protein G6F62_009317 [Rhizopus arrhizus]
MVWPSDSEDDEDEESGEEDEKGNEDQNQDEDEEDGEDKEDIDEDADEDNRTDEEDAEVNDETDGDFAPTVVAKLRFVPTPRQRPSGTLKRKASLNALKLRLVHSSENITRPLAKYRDSSK